MKRFDDTEYTGDSRYLTNEMDGCLETYGEDLEKVLEISEKTPEKLWTVIEGEKGVYISAGYHLVNRLHYIVTLESWKSEDESYIWYLNSDRWEAYELKTQFEVAMQVLEENDLVDRFEEMLCS